MMLKKVFNKTNRLVLLICTIPILVFSAVHKIEDYNSLPSYTNKVPLNFKTDGFQFQDQHGFTKSFKGYKNKIIIVDFFFTSCTSICLKMTQNLITPAEKFKNDTIIQMLSFTVDPKRDSSERLNHYAKTMKAEYSNWDFLTGNKQMIYRMARQNFSVTASEGDGGPDDFIHTDKVILVDRHGAIREYYEGTSKTSIDQLIKDVIKLKHESN